MVTRLFNPGLRERIEVTVILDNHRSFPLGAFPQGAAVFESGEGPPLEGMTSAAYGVRRDSVPDALAVDCPTQPSPQRRAYRKVCRGRKLCTARPAGGFGHSRGWTSTFSGSPLFSAFLSSWGTVACLTVPGGVPLSASPGRPSDTRCRQRRSTRAPRRRSG